MNTKDNRRAQETRAQLKRAYLALLREKPASRITVTEVCRGAGVNRSTFYLHYAEPNDVLKELEDETVGQVAASLGSIAALSSDSPEAEPFLLSFLHNCRENGELLRALLVENSDPHFRRKLQTVALSMAETAFDVDIAPEYKSCTYRYLVSGSIELLTEWIGSDYAIPAETLCELLYRLCEGSLKGVCGE